ncbi:hypothetical protein IMZ08_04730 [Bacillus luteolus]|uniref:Uncharacterized protein n=1 Tax=Litchfieldia luteola TaxID=682179 RepID=A0ABR9QG13_9BACI|nr:hypothetical protein [Cytobacillus luteolus]MBE4907366.1 hypothetical protein [Cytobacillus luteolus]MBP1943914.1 hypothetical protein [Cytobacillus luteolus]
MKEDKNQSSRSTVNHNNNDVKVNNNFSITINLGDAANVLALVVGFCLIKKLLKKS